MNSDPYNHPIVSWVLCSNLANEYLRLAIKSCLDQSFSSFELIFVANGEDADKVASCVKIWFNNNPKIRVFVTPVRHLPFSLSLALHHARGELIARMDSDDISHPRRLELQVSFMNNNPDVAVLGTNYEIINKEGCVIRQLYLPQTNLSIRKALVWGNPFCHPSVMFRRRVILDVGGYLCSLYAEDYDLWTRLSLDHDVIFANLGEVCLSYRSTGPARRSRSAYVSVASSQLRNFLAGGGFHYFLGAMLSIAKLLLRP